MIMIYMIYMICMDLYVLFNKNYRLFDQCTLNIRGGFENKIPRTTTSLQFPIRKI